MGLTVEQAGRSVAEGTSSSRYTQPVYWLDKTSGNAYQVQVEYPQFITNSPEQVNQIPVGTVGGNTIYLRDVADWKSGHSIGAYAGFNQQSFITLNTHITQK